MQHVGASRRAQASAELIYQGLMACLDKKPLDRVSVTDIQRASGVARTTFYRSFDTVVDVLAWKCDESFAQALMPGKGPGWADELELIRHCFAQLAENPEPLDTLIRAGRQDVIYGCHRRVAELLANTYGAVPGLSETDARYFLTLRSGAIVGVLVAWLEGGGRESPEELAEIVARQAMLFAESMAREHDG